MVEVELCVDSAGVGVSDNVHFVLEEGATVDPNVDAVETVVGSGTLRLVRSPNSDVEATEYGNRVFGGAKARGFIAEVDLVWGFGTVDAAVFVDGKQSLGHDGVEGVALMLGLVATDVLGYIAVVTVKVEVDCGYIASMVDVKHFATVVGGNAET